VKLTSDHSAKAYPCLWPRREGILVDTIVNLDVNIVE